MVGDAAICGEQVLPRRRFMRPSASLIEQRLFHMATRLRKTFQYPGEYSDDDDIPKDMDEEGGWGRVKARHGYLAY